jgi:hypothetical protein
MLNVCFWSSQALVGSMQSLHPPPCVSQSVSRTGSAGSPLQSSENPFRTRALFPEHGHSSLVFFFLDETAAISSSKP